MSLYFPLAERWQWPPSVVDAESALLMGALAEIAAVADEVKADKQKSEQRRSAREDNRRR